MIRFSGLLPPPFELDNQHLLISASLTHKAYLRLCHKYWSQDLTFHLSLIYGCARSLGAFCITTAHTFENQILM
jgi:hypothetical protein